MRYVLDALYKQWLLIGDDSIVRGGVGGISSSGENERYFFPAKYRGVIGQLKNIGKVSGIDMAISYAPMPFQCFYSFENKIENHVAQHSVGRPIEEVNKDVARRMEPEWTEEGRFRVYYNPLNNVRNICGHHHCYACADGNYPIDEEFIPDSIKERRDVFLKTA